jgi:hypothetical protein
VKYATPAVPACLPVHAAGEGGQLTTARRDFGSERGAFLGSVKDKGVLAEVGNQLPGGSDIAGVEGDVSRDLRCLITR